MNQLQFLMVLVLAILPQSTSCQSKQATRQISQADSFHCIPVSPQELTYFRKQPPIQFWQKVILLTKDSCIVVHKDSRNMMDVISAAKLDSLVRDSKLE